MSNSWTCTVDLRAQFLRSQGYLVLKLDNRGSSRRGLKFEAFVKNNMGDLEVSDQSAGVQWAVDQVQSPPSRCPKTPNIKNTAQPGPFPLSLCEVPERVRKP